MSSAVASLGERAAPSGRGLDSGRGPSDRAEAPRPRMRPKAVGRRPKTSGGGGRGRGRRVDLENSPGVAPIRSASPLGYHRLSVQTGRESFSPPISGGGR